MSEEEKRSRNMFTGKGGEAAVMSELLFRGFNANILLVDSGIDIAAIKGKRTFPIQVKTKHWNKRNQFLIVLELAALSRFVQSKTFFILVGRSRKTNHNDYIIFPIGVLDKLKKKLKVKKSQRGKPAVRFLLRKLKDGEITLNHYGPVSKFMEAWHLIR